MTGPVNIQADTGSSLDIRIDVNPNAYHGDRSDPNLYVARFGDATRVPEVGTEVTVVQPDDDPTADFVSTATVLEVDRLNRLIKMNVDWKGFHDVEPNRSPIMRGEVTVNYREAVLIDLAYA